MVGASFCLQSFTQTRYDLHRQKVTQVRGAPHPSFDYFFSLFPIALAFFLRRALRSTPLLTWLAC